MFISINVYLKVIFLNNLLIQIYVLIILLFFLHELIHYSCFMFMFLLELFFMGFISHKISIDTNLDLFCLEKMPHNKYFEVGIAYIA